MEIAPRDYLKGKREQLKTVDKEVYKFLYYIFPEEVRKKFEKIIGTKPDFALILNARVEPGKKRIFNSGSYVLFKVKDGVAKVVKDDGNSYSRTRNENARSSRGEAKWDTPETNNIFHFKQN